jgi:hypothetical protein
MAENREDREHNVDDPDYIKLIERLISCFGIDFIFEEASGCGPTAAQKLAERSGLRYRDVDPHLDYRRLHGLSTITGGPLSKPPDFAARTCAKEQFDREDFWVSKGIKGESFQAGLVICGLLHTLSLAGRLRSAGFEVDAYYITRVAQLKQATRL